MMIRLVLLIAGFALLIIQQYIQPISAQSQLIIFLVGIVLLGIPHGAADLLVATRNAENNQKSFSKLAFFANYLGRLALFGIIIWFFPLAGNILFILFAAYHFGETDLHHFKTQNIVGKLFIISYGLVILAVILLHHFEEVKPMFQLVDSQVKYGTFIIWLDEFRYIILLSFGILFFAISLLYFFTNKIILRDKLEFLLRFATILFILYQLPMILGFTFYFIVWHSVLSLLNIINYLRKDNVFSTQLIFKQIGIYSILAMVGIVLFGSAGFMFVNNDTMTIYVFLGLAVLTAPHMQIMHDMYKSMRFSNPSN